METCRKLHGGIFPVWFLMNLNIFAQQFYAEHVEERINHWELSKFKLNSLSHHADNIEFSLGFTGYNSDRIKSNKDRLTSYCSHWPSLLFLNGRRKSIVSICFCNGLLYYFTCTISRGTEKSSLAKTRVKALKIICGKPDENLQPLQASHTDLHVYTSQKCTELRLLSLSAWDVFPEKNKTSASTVQVGKQKFACKSLKKIVMIAVTLTLHIS